MTNETIEIIKNLMGAPNCYRCKYHINEECEEQCTEASNMAIEALEIADRLKQAITDEQTADCIIVDAECVNNKHDKEVWLNGYNQALADIRGDNE